MTILAMGVTVPEACAAAEELEREGIATDVPSCSHSATDISNLPAGTPLADLVGLAELRRRIEHDYRELKDALGLDHFEGRSLLGAQNLRWCDAAARWIAQETRPTALGELREDSPRAPSSGCRAGPFGGS